jgi:tyrosyl-tRNA synthetase
MEELKKQIPAKTNPSNLIEALVETGLASSNSDARRLLGSGAVYINGNSINRENFEDQDFKNGRLLLRRGKAYKDSALILVN